MQVDSRRGQVRGQSSGTQDDAESKKLRTVGGLGVNLLQTFYVATLLVSSVVPEPPTYYATRSGIWLDPALVEAGRQRERELMQEFGVYERVLRSEARGKRVGAQWLHDDRCNDDGSMYVRARLVATQVAWEARSDCFASVSSLFAL